MRYVRLTPLAQSLSLEASLGRDLQAVQKQTQAAKASLAQLQVQCSLPEIQTHHKHSLGSQLSSTAWCEVLERPDGRQFKTLSHG